MRRAVIDDIVFQAAPLGERAASWPPSLAVHLPTATGQKGFTQPLPFFARSAALGVTDINWPAYCNLLKDFGIPLATTAASLDSLSVANVPARFTRREADEGFDALELETAEAIVISCSRRLPSGWVAEFPLEVSAWHELKVLIDTLRELAPSSTPIGLAVAAGDVSADVSNALAARADFVILEQPPVLATELTTAEIDLLVWNVAAARAACTQAGAGAFPIFVEAALTRADDLIKILALGASAVSIDAVARSCLVSSAAATPAPAKGMLSGIGALPKATQPNVGPLHKELTGLVDAVISRLRQQQLSRIEDLSAGHLRALSVPAARLAGIALLAR